MYRTVIVTRYICVYGHKFTKNEGPQNTRLCPQCRQASKIVESYQTSTTTARERSLKEMAGHDS